MITRVVGVSLFYSLIAFYAVTAHIEYKPCSSSQFVNRWAFQSLCDFVFDARKVWPTDDLGAVTFDPQAVKEGDMVFVRDASLFFKKMHNAIQVPYFIMTHGEYLDKFIPAHFKYLDDPKILGWFTIHPCSQSHERVFAIPLGIIQYKELCTDWARKNVMFEKLRDVEKKELLYMNFTDWGNPGRKKIRQFFATKPFCKSGTLTHFGPYINELAKYKFVVSPPGLGPDCYRVWESLLIGTIPIVQRSPIDWLYEGLPVLFINEWEEVTESFLKEKYQEICAQSYSCEKLYMDYWIRFIQKTRKRCLKRYRKDSEQSVKDF